MRTWAAGRVRRGDQGRRRVLAHCTFPSPPLALLGQSTHYHPPSHTPQASPFHFNAPDPYKDLINPAVEGTLNALKSAKKEPSVKRVVITASFACIVEPKDPGTYVFTEKDWNEYSPKQVSVRLR